MAKTKYKCEVCDSVFTEDYEKCPNCGCDEIYEMVADEKLDAVRHILRNQDLCAEAMVAEIGEIVFADEDDEND